MREILFRGKHIRSGEWAYGSFVHRTLFYGDPCDEYYILKIGEFDCDYYIADKVTPDTIGQYTGMTDKNGTKIFEGDIVRYETYEPYHNRSSVGVETVKFISGQFSPRPHCQTCEDDYYTEEYRNFEVIGNIHDNPELLEQA